MYPSKEGSDNIMATMTMEQIKKVGFNHLTRSNMEKYIEDNCADRMKDFMRVSYCYYDTKQVFDKNGKPVLTKSHMSKKTGEPTKPRVKTQRIAIAWGTDEYKARKKAGEKPSFDAMKAKRWFCGEFCPELIPVKKTPEKVDATLNKYESLLDED